MTPDRKSKTLALLMALILAGPAYWVGYHAAIHLLRQESQEYRVWQESYHVDRRFYDAIAKNPPPRYQPPRPWEGHLGGGLAASVIAVLSCVGITRFQRNAASGSAPPPARNSPGS